MQNKNPRCPKCSGESLSVERRPNGDASCLSCNWKGPYNDCFMTQDKKKEDEMKLREWWIFLKEFNNPIPQVYTQQQIGFDYPEQIHVIEYSVFQKLREENEALRAKLEKAIEQRDEIGNAFYSGYHTGNSIKSKLNAEIEEVLAKYPKDEK